LSAEIKTERPIVAVVGPTASGKSDLGIALALRLGGEVINCDSVQVYREIEIATAKVPPHERRGVPHHLIDFVPPERNYTAADWARDALAAIDGIEARGRTALLVGGTGFYLRALREPFFEAPPTEAGLRRRLVTLRERRGAEHLAPRDWSRVQRALELRLQTGEKLSARMAQSKAPPPQAARLRVFVLNPPREELYRRIDLRAEAHFRAGLVEEVRGLLARGVPAGGSALGAHGYRRVVEYLRGERTLESAVEQTKLDVRHYAKRQLTWFRREPGVEWVEGFGEDPAVQEEAARRLGL
jgi:tRNA dimethylallyltransferase